MKNKASELTVILFCCITLAAVACGKSNGIESSTPSNGTEAHVTQNAPAVTEPAVIAAATEAAEGKLYCIDYLRTYNNATGTPTFAETDESLYYLADNMVYFTDKEYKEWMPLCPRPDCRHNNNECSAYINSESLILYGKYLYYIEGSGMHEINEKTNFKLDLCRMNLDGTGHETVCELREMLTPNYSYEPDLASWDFYSSNKYLIAEADFALEGASVTVFHRYAYSFDLETLQALPILAEYSSDKDYEGFILLEGAGDHAYAEIYYQQKKHKIVDIDLASGSVRELCEIEGSLAYWERGLGIVDGKLCFCIVDIPQGAYTDAEYNHLYELDIETGQLDMVDETIGIYAKWRVLDTLSGYWYSTIWGDDDIRGTYICDIDRNEIMFLPAVDYPEETGGKLSIGRVTEDYVFAMPRNAAGSLTNYAAPIWYLNKADIGTDNLMWRKWEP